MVRLNARTVAFYYEDITPSPILMTYMQYTCVHMLYFERGFKRMANKVGLKQRKEADARLAEERKSNLRKPAKNDKLKKSLVGTGFLSKVTPRKGYSFSSDYFKIDDAYATILTVFNKDGSDDNLPPMWGISFIPRTLGDGVVTRLITQVNQAEQKWVDQKQGKADDSAAATESEANRTNRSKDGLMASKKKRDYADIARDLANGDSYLYVAFKIFIKAPSLQALETAIERLQREYDTKFGAVYIAPYEGRQRDDLTNLFRSAEKQLGKNYMFTSSEIAGFYNLVTHGIEDEGGEYVGQMRADVNNAAVLWEMDHYDSHVIVASDNRPQTLGYPESSFKSGEKSSTLWGVKLSQAALINNHRVVHFVLNNADIENIGVDLSGLTSKVSMSKGDINPFEMFGNVEHEMEVYSAQIEKMRLMTQQMNPSIDDIGLSTLASELNKFYIGHRMWSPNAMENRSELRVVGIPHEHVPRLNKFVAYLKSAHQSYIQKSAVDPNIAKALSSLAGLYQTMLETNGDLFDTITSSAVDDSAVSPRVIYDLSSLMKRGTGVAMAQFINALGFATNSLSDGDVVVIHGADKIDKGVLEYTRNCIDDLKSKNVRVAFLYDNVDKMLNNIELNDMVKADWILTGYMANPSIIKYQEVLTANIPEALSKAVSSKNHVQYYLRRGLDNIIFDADLIFE